LSSRAALAQLSVRTHTSTRALTSRAHKAGDALSMRTVQLLSIIARRQATNTHPRTRTLAQLVLMLSVM
jgi:hypothetical protein